MSSSTAVTVTVWASFQSDVMNVRLGLSTVATDFLVHEGPWAASHLEGSSLAVTVIVTLADGGVSSTTV